MPSPSVAFLASVAGILLGPVLLQSAGRLQLTVEGEVMGMVGGAMIGGLCGAAFDRRRRPNGHPAGQRQPGSSREGGSADQGSG